VVEAEVRAVANRVASQTSRFNISMTEGSESIHVVGLLLLYILTFASLSGREVIKLV
jgi:hypothetical protein